MILFMTFTYLHYLWLHFVVGLLINESMKAFPYCSISIRYGVLGKSCVWEWVKLFYGSSKGLRLTLWDDYFATSSPLGWKPLVLAPTPTQRKKTWLLGTQSNVPKYCWAWKLLMGHVRSNEFLFLGFEISAMVG